MNPDACVPEIRCWLVEDVQQNIRMRGIKERKEQERKGGDGGAPGFPSSQFSFSCPSKRRPAEGQLPQEKPRFLRKYKELMLTQS